MKRVCAAAAGTVLAKLGRATIAAAGDDTGPQWLGAHLRSIES